MPRHLQHAAAALIAILITTTTFVAVVTVPSGAAQSVAVAPMLA